MLRAGSFDSAVTLPIRLQIDDRESRRSPLSIRFKNSKRRLAAKPSASITPSDIPGGSCCLSLPIEGVEIDFGCG
jgi:hypothetical protein